MAWNDPPSINYQQLSSQSGNRFKHRYLSGSKLGQSEAAAAAGTAAAAFAAAQEQAMFAAAAGAHPAHMGPQDAQNLHNQTYQLFNTNSSTPATTTNSFHPIQSSGIYQQNHEHQPNLYQYNNNNNTQNHQHHNQQQEQEQQPYQQHQQQFPYHQMPPQ